ncbi:MAG TPA: ABC transporter ATP-binding protein [Steroidobacteraceae bacterium]
MRHVPTIPRDGALVEMCSVVKTFGPTVALNGITLRVLPGEVLALLGPNGAGKTTLLSLMLGLCKPTRGLVRVCGLEAHHPAVRHQVGGMLQNTGVPAGLRVGEIFALYRRCFDRALTHDALMALTGLAPKLDRLAGSLSAGERQRLLIGLAFMGHPLVAILDEPGAMLDGAGREALHATMRDFANQRRAVVFSTHHMEEARAVATRVLVLKNGGLSCSLH